VLGFRGLGNIYLMTTASDYDSLGGNESDQKPMRTVAAQRLMLLASLALALLGSSGAEAGFRSPESLVRNVYAYYGDRTSALSGGLPHNAETAHQFFDSSLRDAWALRSKAPYDFLVQSADWKLGAISISILRKQYDRIYVTAGFDNRGRPVTMNFILVNGAEGWVIYDVESPHDSLRAYLAQYRD
jgi:hypothetical protein